MANDEYLSNFLQQKSQQMTGTLTLLSKFDDLRAKLNVLTCSVNKKLRHLLRSISTTRDPVRQFCQDFDQQIMQFFKHNFHIQETTECQEMQIRLSTSNLRLVLLSIPNSATTAYLASTRNLLPEVSLRCNNSPLPAKIMHDWSIGGMFNQNWDAIVYEWIKWRTHGTVHLSPWILS